MAFTIKNGKIMDVKDAAKLPAEPSARRARALAAAGANPDGSPVTVASAKANQSTFQTKRGAKNDAQ